MGSMSVLRTMADWLEGTYHRVGRGARGTRAGVPTAVRFTLRGTGYERTSSERQWTEIDVQLPPGYALSLYVRRHEWTDAYLVERGAMVDVEIGDPAFDRAFLIEAAPAMIARILLDHSVRRLLVSHHAGSLTTESLGGRSVVRLSARTWLGHEALAVAIDVLVGLSTRLRDVYAAVDVSALRDAGSPYRPQLDDAQVDAQRAALAREVAAVARLRSMR